MKKAIKLTLAFALVMGSTTLFAQKFGRINTQEIIMSMPETKTMQENMETFAKELQDNIETMNVEFNTKLQEYQKGLNTYNEAVREMKEKELQDLQNRSREFQERAQQDYQKKQNELLAPIIDKAKAAIDQDFGSQRLYGRIRHLDRFAGLFRRSYADRHRSPGEEGAGHHRCSRCTRQIKSRRSTPRNMLRVR